MSEAATKPRSSDPRVATAIAHWAPRFVSNGVLLADFEEVTAGIERWEDWCRAWCERGEVHEALGREALEDGYKLTAGEHLSSFSCTIRSRCATRTCARSSATGWRFR